MMNTYFLMYFNQMKACFEKYTTCNICGTKLSLYHDQSRRLGFSLLFQISCSDCAFEDQFFSLLISNKRNLV